jgi:PAS domain S-box-containing protein
VEVLATFLLVSGLISGLSASRDHAEAALRVGERRFRTMLESANEGVWQVDRDARTQYANDRMAALLGATREQVASGTVSDFVFAEDLPAARQRIGANLSGHAEVFDFRFRRADGEEVLVLAGTSPVRDRAGRSTGALGFYSDVTERRRAESALARANERFALASDAVQSLIYEWDLATNRVERTAGLLPLLGYRPDEAPETLDWWNERIHPEDRPRIVEESARLDWEDDRYSRQYRMQHRDGHWITVWDQGRIVRDRHGHVLRVIGSTVDITARTEAEEALRFLAEAGRALASSLDFEETLQRVAWLTVPRFADWCVVDLVADQGSTRRAAIAYADPEEAGTAAGLMHFAPTSGGGGPEEQVLRTGTPLVV